MMRSIVLVDGRLHVALAGALEEEADDKDLQAAHEDDQAALDDADVDDPALGAPDGGKVAVLARAEVLLAPGDGRQFARQLEEALLQGAGLFGGGALLGGDLGALLVLDLWQDGLVKSQDGEKHEGAGRTAISKSTNFSANVLISLLKQNS